MERRNFLKLALGVAAGSATFAAGALAAPLSPQPIEDPARLPPTNADAHPAVTTSEETAELKPEQVHWHGYGGWHHRHWGRRHRWHHRRWHRW